MRNAWIITAIFLVAALSPSVAHADNFLYSYTGEGAFNQTEFTYLSVGGHISDPSGFLSTPTKTDLIFFGNDLGAFEFELSGVDLIFISPGHQADDTFVSIPFDPGPGTYVTQQGSQFVITDVPNVPEPSTLILSLAMLIGIVLARRIRLA